MTGPHLPRNPENEPSTGPNLEDFAPHPTGDNDTPTVFDVAVIGGGFTGLATARNLQDGGKSVVLLEGNDRLGGRSYSRPSSFDSALTVELGGGSFNRSNHPRVSNEVERYKIETHPVVDIKVFRNDVGVGHHETRWPVPVEEARQANSSLSAALTDARRVDLQSGLEYQGLDDLDIPLADYLDGLKLPEATRTLVEAWTWKLLGQSASDASALWALRTIAAHRYDVAELVDSSNEIFAGGAGALIRALESDVRDVRLNHLVSALHQTDDDVTVYAGDTVVRARNVVVATPLNTWREMEFEPPLPKRRAEVIGQGHAGAGFEVLIHVKDVEEGLLSVGDGVFPMIRDYRRLSDGSHVLVASTDRSLFDPTDFDAVSNAVRQYIPDAEVLGFDFHDWIEDAFFRGSWFAPGVHQVTQPHGLLSDPHHRIHFAGSDVSLKFPGLIEGAFETADRVASEILAT